MIAYSVGRVLALLSLVWSVRHVILAAEVQDVAVSRFLLVWALLWGVLALFLGLGRGVVAVSSTILTMCAAELLLLELWAEYAIMLIAWLALALVVAPHRRHEQVFLARILLSTVYAFAALSKLQPSWMMGENLRLLVASRPQAAWLEPFLLQPWLSLAAAAVVVAELWLAIGLWLRRTRLLTAVMGVLLHIVLTTLAATDGMPGLLHLLALNGGLVVIYPAFWQPLMPAGANE